MTALRARVAPWIVFAVLGAAACDRSSGSPPADTGIGSVDSTAVEPPPPSDPSWLPALGPVVAIPVDSTTGWILHGDIEAVSQGAAAVRLLDDDGGVTPAEIVGTRRDAPGCDLVNLGGAAAVPWSVAVAGPAQPLPLRPMEAMARPDSQRFARELARLASRIPTGADDRFSGLPFVVVSMWSGTLPDSTPLLVARIRRQINQEASPMEEQTIIVAERRGDTWTSRYTHRARGLEETMEATHLLALLDGDPLTLILSSESAAGTGLTLLERRPDGWHERHVSPLRRCP